MLKLILWILVIFVGFKLMKFVKSDLKTTKKVATTTPPPIEDVMLQDPYCKTYFPKNQGVVARIQQNEVYFCCVECKNAFMNQFDSSK